MTGKKVLLACAALVCAMPVAALQAQQEGKPVFSAEQIERAKANQAIYDAMPETSGSGRYPAMIESDQSLPHHVIYRPRDLSKLGETKLGVLVWGNGGCTDDGASARLHLEEIASHGYLVIAPGDILTGPSKPADARAPMFMTTTGADMIAGLDWALAQNRQRGSRYFGKIDPGAVALSGHSCGGILSIQMSADPRVKTLIIHNSGVFPNIPQRPQLITDKAWLQDRLHTPILYLIGNETDVGHQVAVDDFARIDKVPVFIGQLEVGHGGTFHEPNGGLGAQVALAWLEWRLRGDRRAAKMFTGRDCRLCHDARWTIQRKKIG